MMVHTIRKFILKLRYYFR